MPSSLVWCLAAYSPPSWYAIDVLPSGASRHRIPSLPAFGHAPPVAPWPTPGSSVGLHSAAPSRKGPSSLDLVLLRDRRHVCEPPFAPHWCPPAPSATVQSSFRDFAVGHAHLLLPSWLRPSLRLVPPLGPVVFPPPTSVAAAVPTPQALQAPGCSSQREGSRCLALGFLWPRLTRPSLWTCVSRPVSSHC